VSDPLVRALEAVNRAVSSQDVDRLAVCLNTVTLAQAMLPLLASHLDGIEEGDVETIRATLDEAGVRIRNAMSGWAEPRIDLEPLSALDRPTDWLRLAACAIELRDRCGPADLLRKRSDRRLAIAALESILDLAPDEELQNTIDTIAGVPRRRAA
jgi:hypothetical protein